MAASGVAWPSTAARTCVWELTSTTFTLATHRQRHCPACSSTALAGCKYAAAWGVTRSMSRTLNPDANALAESVAGCRRARSTGCLRQAVSHRSAVAPLKTEGFKGEAPATRATARLLIFDSIETFHHPHRRHSALGYRSPLQFEEEMPPNHPPLTSIH